MFYNIIKKVLAPKYGWIKKYILLEGMKIKSIYILKENIYKLKRKSY